MNNLVIVESPTKARTLARFLGGQYQIEASMGHVRDLPKSKLGVDVEHNFEPQYIIPKDKQKRVNELKKLAKGAKEIYLATDPDREGEAIAWHLAHIVENKNIKRVEFHEITEGAINEAFKNPREINLQLVDAQQARRVLDRLVGYKLSPLLWKKIKRGLSAGRVQSVALRLIVEREREIKAFKPVEYWSIEVELESRINPPAGGQESRFFVKLVEYKGEKLDLENPKSNFLKTKENANLHVTNLQKADYFVSQVNKKEIKRYPSAPFITSTLQQTAGNKLGFTVKKTMLLAQNLYEHGFISYMRTDSFNLSSQAVSAIRNYVSKSLGSSYLPSSPRIFKSKSKNAQEAHEAIRPTKIGNRMLASLSLRRSGSDIGGQNGLTRDHARLYDLIWKRAVASQMVEAVMDQTSVDVKADQDYLLRASGSILKFDGWLKIYGVTPLKEDDEKEEDKNQILPELVGNEQLKLLNLLPEQHFTEPPPRYTEPSLIKKLEELGIGRPSTYAPILSTIQERYYVERLEKKFSPTPLGFAVNDFLIKFFPQVFDFEFTALMEDQLDEISRGERPWRDSIKEFYGPFEKKVEETENTAGRVKLEVEKVDKKCPKCGKDLVVRIGKFGKFLACLGFPDCKHTENFGEVINTKCPKDGADLVVRRTKKRRTFYGCKNYPNCKYASWTKPKS